MDSPYKIEKGLPLPDISLEFKAYPFGEMDKGDSFFVPLSDFSIMYSTAQLKGHLYRMQKQFIRFTGKQFVFSQVRKSDGIRIFRMN